MPHFPEGGVVWNLPYYSTVFSLVFNSVLVVYSNAKSAIIELECFILAIVDVRIMK